MKFLQNKIIVIVSPQDWGKMLLSKHHYALELAKAGNKVYFLNPPSNDKSLGAGEIVVNESGIHDNLFMIRHRLYYPYSIKFRSLSLFHWLMKWQVKSILKKIGRKVDIVWSFDIGHLYPFRLFPAECKKVFHPVDEPLRREAINAASGADIILSVTPEILSKYHSYDIRKEFINHGVSKEFVDRVISSGRETHTDVIRIGYAGNLLRPDLDRSTILKIIGNNLELEFHFFGSYQLKDANIGGSEDEESQNFIKSLQQHTHVHLHGALDQKQLADEFAKMDAFLVCYDIDKDQSKGTNYHKLMEYISTGKVVIANNITNYANAPHLIQMTQERSNNEKLPALFKSVIDRLSDHNSQVNMEKRREFALDNIYPKQLEKIDSHLNSLRT
jgi:glycosyltransferase involved in cell wall biosynthesis